MFEGFATFEVETDAGTVFGRTAGSGPPLLLLHGIPQTHLMWRHVAPALARHHTVVVTDLRGFGRTDPELRPAAESSQSMSDIAGQQAEVMAALGHRAFVVAGHDRGGRCAYRMAIDHPDRVAAVAVLDVVPTGHVYEHADERFASGFWVWSFLSAPAPVPERLIGADPDVLVDHMLDTWTERPESIDETVRPSYREQFHDPSRVHTICEQYRAAATIDTDQDLADRGSDAIQCPLLALWSSTGAVADWYDPIAVWSEWAQDVQGRAVTAGHFLAEEAPDEVADALLTFFRESAQPR